MLFAFFARTYLKELHITWTIISINHDHENMEICNNASVCHFTHFIIYYNVDQKTPTLKPYFKLSHHLVFHEVLSFSKLRI